MRKNRKKALKSKNLAKIECLCIKTTGIKLMMKMIIMKKKLIKRIHLEVKKQRRQMLYEGAQNFRIT
jgi:hypothetical protein